MQLNNIRIIYGDFTQANVDFIFNAANTRILGGGVDNCKIAP